MSHLVELIQYYGLAFVFVNVLLLQAGLPVPAYPTLIITGALATRGGASVPALLAVAVVAALIADLAWYAAGRRFGSSVLKTICRVSLSPDSCVRQTEDLFGRAGAWSLLFVRYLPGLTNITVAMAAITRMRLPAFILFNMAGAAIYFGVPALSGALFYRAIDDVLDTMIALGTMGIAVVVAALALYVMLRWWQRQAFIRQLRMDRISVSELIAMIDAGDIPIILDVRSAATRARDGIIPGALAAHPQDSHPDLLDFDRDAEIVVYCACPNEASAATAAQHLRKAGFRKIRPLLGGVDAWVGAGRSLEGTV